MLAVDIIKANTKTALVTHPPRLNGRGDIKGPPTAVCVHHMTFQVGDLGEGGALTLRGEKAPSLVRTYHVKKTKGNETVAADKPAFSDQDTTLCWWINMKKPAATSDSIWGSGTTENHRKLTWNERMRTQPHPHRLQQQLQFTQLVTSCYWRVKFMLTIIHLHVSQCKASPASFVSTTDASQFIPLFIYCNVNATSVLYSVHTNSFATLTE